jgi:CheY-like chemotaxis protein
MPHRILVIDDVPDVCEALAKLLEALGHEGECVTDPRDAVKVACSFRPKMVFLDIGMPYINGYQLCPMLRTALEPPRLVIVAVTAWGSEQDRAHSRAVGFDAHLVKPMDSTLIAATITELLEQGRNAGSDDGDAGSATH